MSTKNKTDYSKLPPKCGETLQLLHEENNFSLETASNTLKENTMLVLRNLDMFSEEDRIKFIENIQSLAHLQEYIENLKV